MKFVLRGNVMQWLTRHGADMILVLVRSPGGGTLIDRNSASVESIANVILI